MGRFGQIAPTLTHDHETARTPGRVLHLVNDALPTTSAGYTIRTHEIVLAQKAAGLDPHVVTRCGFPVTQGTLEGQSTLVLDYTSPAPPAGYHERLIISSATGIPIEFLGGQAGQAPSATMHYKISRVTVSAIESGSYPGS